MTTMPLRKILARNVRHYMETCEHVQTQVKLAKAAGIAQSSIARVLKGEIDTQLQVVQALAEAIGVPASALLEDGTDQAVLRYDRALVASLPSAEKSKIESFIDFVLSQSSTTRVENDGSLTVSEDIPPTASTKRRAAAAAQRPLSNDSLSNEEKSRRTATHRETRKQRK